MTDYEYCHSADKQLARDAVAALTVDRELVVRLDCWSREEYNNTLDLIPADLRNRVFGTWPAFGRTPGVQLPTEGK